MPFSGTSVSQFGTAHCMWRGGGVGKESLSLRVPARRVTTRKNPEGSRGSCTWILRPSSSQTHSARPHLTKLLLGGLPQSSRGSQGRIGGHTVRLFSTEGKKQRKPRGERKAGKPPAPVLNHPAPLQPRRPGSGCPCLAPVCPADYRSHDARTMRRGPSCNGYHEPNGGPRIKQRWDSSDRAQLPFDPSESAGCFLVQRQAEGLEPGPELSHSSHGKGSFFSL